MNLEIIVLSEVSQRKTNIMIPHVNQESKENTNELIYKQKQTHRYRKQFKVTKGEGGVRVKLDLWD